MCVYIKCTALYINTDMLIDTYRYSEHFYTDFVAKGALSPFMLFDNAIGLKFCG